ncbi:hypothetical protein HPB48_008778 [Haemaphysalis longicornis]|uniref:Thioredoxin domain-containing protein n=1 Tax=Haemaphysalis longicornis TaxID=44386 RepID=A0A9J6FWJ2_HAELO|nr:hypothetical protein HPB48_008778 [Haemaphysalis longicornis]
MAEWRMLACASFDDSPLGVLWTLLPSPVVQEDFSKKLDEAGDKLVVVDFYATWCGPCKMIEPFLKQQSEIYKDQVVFLKVDVDENEEIASQYEISCMPTFLFIKKREKVRLVDVLEVVPCLLS